MSKACPIHGPIDWPMTALVCPVRGCGEELEAYDSPLEMALALPPSAPAEVQPVDVRANERQMIVARAMADAAAADRRLRGMGLRRGR